MSGFPTLRAAFQQFAAVHPEHPLAPETTVTNATLSPGLIGVSFLSCLGDIAKHRVAQKDVGTIVASFSGHDSYPRNTVHLSGNDVTAELAHIANNGVSIYEKVFGPSGDAALAAKQLQHSGKIWRSTAFPTPEGKGHSRRHGSFGPYTWIDPKTGDLLRFWNPSGKPERKLVDWDHIQPDELELLAGLHQFYPNNQVFKKAFESVDGRLSDHI